MDNGARLPLYARARLGEGTRAAHGLHGVVGLSGGNESGCPAVEVGRGRLPPWKGRCSWERKSFRMERALAEPGSHPSPSLGIVRSACGEAEPWEPRQRGKGWGKTASNLSGLRPGPALPPEPLCSSWGCLFFPLCLGNAVLPRLKPICKAVVQILLGASMRNNHLVSKEAKIQGKRKLRAWQEYGGFAASPPLFA